MSAILIALKEQLELGSSTYIVISLVVGFLLYRSQTKKHVNWPPSPFAWPIVGHIPMVNQLKPHVTYTKWADKLGSIIRVRMGLLNFVILSDVETIKEAFNRDTTAGRPDMEILSAFAGGKLGIVVSDGELWKEQRRFTLSVLRDLGLGRSVMEENIAFETEVMLNQINQLVARQKPDCGVDLSLPVKNCIANVILSVMFGERFEPGDPDFEEFERRTMDIVKYFQVVDLRYFFGPLKYVLPRPAALKLMDKNSTAVRHIFIRKRIQKQASLLKANPDVEARNVAIAYLKRLEDLIDTADSKEMKQNYFSHPQLESILNDLFIAGLETSVTTMAWAWLFMVHYPDVQRKVHNELDNFGRQPKWEDRKYLPYTVATLTEIQRLANVAVLGAPHVATEDVTIRGYMIPKGTIIFANLWGAHLNEKSFPEPLKLKPERFIDPVTGAAIGADKIIPFSTGKRVCLGESLARMEIFLVFTAVLCNFTLAVPDGAKLPTLEPIPGGGTLVPQPCTVKLIKRK